MSQMYDDTNELIKKYNIIINNNTIPTRNDSIIDIIMSKNQDKIIQTEVIQNREGSDHHPLVRKRAFNNSIEAQNYIYFCDYNRYDVYDIQNRLIYDNRYDIILNSNNPAEATQLLVDIINDAVKISASMKKKQSRRSKMKN